MTKKTETRDWVEEYEEFTKNALLEDPPKDERQDRFLERVLGRELKRWLDRGGKYGYGLCYDEDGEVIEEWPEED